MLYQISWQYPLINYLNLNTVNFFCEWCNVQSRNQNDLDEHLAGEKHQSKAYTKKKNSSVQNGPQDGAAANATASSSRKKHKGKAKVWILYLSISFPNEPLIS